MDKKHKNNNDIPQYILNICDYKISNCTELWIDGNVFNNINCMNWNDIQFICDTFKSLKQLYLCNGYKLDLEFLRSLTKIIEHKNEHKYSLETITILSEDDSWCYKSMKYDLFQFTKQFENN